MNIAIYQINSERDVNRVKFTRMDLLEKYQGSAAIDSSLYDRVFQGEISGHGLEDVYRKFNVGHPAGFAGHSLSVSDVVEICDDAVSGLKKGFYFCDSFGFKKVAFEPEKTQVHIPENAIQVVIMEPGVAPRVENIQNELRVLQSVVGGHIEMACPFNDNVAIICNEEGKLLGLPHNRTLRDENGRYLDSFCGAFFVTGIGEEDFCSLTDEQAARYMEVFKTPEISLNDVIRSCEALKGPEPSDASSMPRLDLDK